MSKITPFLWFDTQALEAAQFYTAIFKNSKIHGGADYTKSGAEMSGQDAGSVMTVSFELDGQQFIALNGGPNFKFTEAVSFVIDCGDQEEVDYYWDKLLAGGGEESQCGWLKDKFGLSWQVIPKQLGELMSDPNADKANRVMQAMLKMKKIIIADLESAAGNNE